MKSNLIQGFRVLYLVGLIFLLLSFFLDWYSFQIFDSNKNILVSWNYNVLFEWSTPLSDDFALNRASRPENISVPWVINLIAIISIIVSGYIVLFKNVEQTESTKYLIHFTYVNAFLLLLVLFFLLVFPLLYLLPRALYFPLIYLEDLETGFNYFYSIGFGYLSHIIAFLLIFPYNIFYFRTANQFEKENNTPEMLVKKLIKRTEENLDLDKLIAQEEIKSKFKNSNQQHYVDPILNRYIKGAENTE